MVDHHTETTASVAINGVTWHKSTASGGGAQSSCVEIAMSPELVLVRDSKDTAGPKLGFSLSTWRRFAAAVSEDIPY